MRFFSLFTRQVQEDFYMRSAQQHDAWLFSSPGRRTSQRDSPERRRQQARGRSSAGRPASVGSASFGFPSASHHAAAELARLRALEPREAVAEHRPSTPGLARQHSDNSSAAYHSPTHSNSSEETSPAVAVGSGVAMADRTSSAVENRHNALSQAMWPNPFGLDLSQIERNQMERDFYPRANDFPRAVSYESENSIPAPNNQYAAGDFTNPQSGDLHHPGPFGHHQPR